MFNGSLLILVSVPRLQDNMQEYREETRYREYVPVPVHKRTPFHQFMAALRDANR